MISPDKATMFRNRLNKVYRHVNKLAKKQESLVTGFMTTTFLSFLSVLKCMKTALRG